jgi:L-amino acid N-acyltransferase
LLVRSASENDIPEILEIYNDAVLNSTATFERNPQTIESRRIWYQAHDANHPLIVAEDNHKSIIGYCSLSKFQSNSGYSRTLELSVYVKEQNRRQGVATILMKEILVIAKRIGVHAIISSISADNVASVKLHEKLGFEKVAQLKQVGYKFSKWHDTCYYELII